MADNNPWAGIGGALDQKLYNDPPKPEAVLPQPKRKDENEPKKPEPPTAMKTEKKECQLNAWITSRQNSTLDRLYFQLRAKGVKIKKGELVGVGIEVLAGIIERFSPKTIDATLLDEFLISYERKQHKKQS